MRIQHLFHEMSLGSLTGRDAPEEAPPKEVANYAPLLLWSIWVLTVVSAIFLALRVYAKLMRRRSLWWDDHFLILSWVRTPTLLNTARSRSRSTASTGVDANSGLSVPDLDPGLDRHAHRRHQVGDRPPL